MVKVFLKVAGPAWRRQGIRPPPFPLPFFVPPLFGRLTFLEGMVPRWLCDACWSHVAYMQQGACQYAGITRRKREFGEICFYFQWLKICPCLWISFVGKFDIQLIDEKDALCVEALARLAHYAAEKRGESDGTAVLIVGFGSR
jgi:hypothetical protein